MYEKPVLERYGTFREVTQVIDDLCIPELTPGCNDFPNPNGTPSDRS